MRSEDKRRVKKSKNEGREEKRKRIGKERKGSRESKKVYRRFYKRKNCYKIIHDSFIVGHVPQILSRLILYRM